MTAAGRKDIVGELDPVPRLGLSSNARRLRAALLRARLRPASSGPGSVAGRRGEGYEFVELRAYQPGDDPRRIDWAATARSGDVQLRVMREENPLQIAAIVDRSNSMLVGVERALADAAADARSAWYEIAEPGDRIVPFDEDETVERSLAVARRALRPSAALLVVSDFYWLRERPELADLALALGRRVDVTALVARDPWYDALPLRGFVRLRDAESGRVERYFIGRAERSRFRAAVERREREVRARVAEFGWRTGILAESDGRGSLYAAFGLA